MRWGSPGITLVLGLATLVLGNELIWRRAIRSLAPLAGQHWSERARIWVTWRSVIASWHMAVVVSICLVQAALAPRDTLDVTLGLAALAAPLSVALTAKRNARWIARVTGIEQPRSVLRATIAFHAIFLSSFWIAIGFGIGMPRQYDAAGIGWALLLLLGLLLNGLGASGWLLRTTGILEPARPHVVEAVESARRELPSPRPDVRVFEVELSYLNALAYPGTSILAFTKPAVEALTPAQLTAIAAHELEHLQESRAARALRVAWSMCFALPVLFVPVLPHANGLLLGLGLFFVGALVYRSASLRLEQRADAAATHRDQGGADYAVALERLYELNLIPATFRVRQAHPHLYDRMLAAGVTPSFPRPRPPPIWPPIVSPLLVVLCCVGGLVAQVALTSRLAAGLDLRDERQRNWAVSLEGRRADWLAIAVRWLEQGRLRDAGLALALTEREEWLPALVLRASIAARSGNCERAATILRIARLTECGTDCTGQLLERCDGRCEDVVVEYAHLRALCPRD